MLEKSCNIWIERADWRCIPTIGATAPDGAAVLEAQVSREAAQRFRDLEYDLGRLLVSRGNHVHELRPGLASFPIKQYAWASISLDIVRRSAQELARLVGSATTLLARPDLKAGDPPWEEFAKALAGLPDTVTVVKHS